MNSFARGILMHFRLLYVWDSCLGMQITVKRKCKCSLKYIWVYFALRDGIVDLCYKSAQNTRNGHAKFRWIRSECWVHYFTLQIHLLDWSHLQDDLNLKKNLILGFLHKHTRAMG